MIGIRPFDDEYAADSRNSRDKEQGIFECLEARRIVDGVERPLSARHCGAVDDRHCNGGADKEEHAYCAEAHLAEGGDKIESGAVSELMRMLGMIPVPARVGMTREDYGVVVFAVLGQQLAVCILRYPLLKKYVEPCFIKEHAEDEPKSYRNARESHAEPKSRYRDSKIDKTAHYETVPACIGNTAYRRTGRHRKLLLSRLDAYLAELVAHVVGVFLLIRGARQPRTDLLRSVLDDVKRFFCILFIFFFHFDKPPCRIYYDYLPLKLFYRFEMLLEAVAVPFTVEVEANARIHQQSA